MLPEIPLIYIGSRLYFTYFADPAPHPDDLNRGDGLASAVFAAPGVQSHGHGDRTPLPLPKKFHWFNIDEEFIYLSFFEDWGPLNVAVLYKFCMMVHSMLADTRFRGKALVLYTSSDPCRKANASLLAALYSMFIEHLQPAEAFQPFSALEFRPFRDAGYGRADYYLTIQDILYGVFRANKEGLLDLSQFNVDEYEYYEQVANGDWNWITPNFLAFASPNDRDYVAALKANGGKPLPSNAQMGRRLPPTFTNMIRYFRQRNIKLVVRLNNPLYDKAVFEDAGIQHVDLYFDDGSNPSTEILKEFIRLADDVIRKGGAIAVHCKAGLGRTGVLIGAYLIWKYGFSASEIIGFMRIMRPGCVVGPQQHFMYQNFAEWIRWGVRDDALAEARRVLDKERAKLAASDAANLDSLRNLKRPSTPEQEGGAGSPPPVTPRAKKVPHVVPATAAPAVKPVPCVGQPRKSPSPSRKRPLTASTLNRSEVPLQPSLLSNDLPRSASDESLSTLDSKHSLGGTTTPQAPGTPNGGVHTLRNSWEALSSAANTTPRRASPEAQNRTPTSSRVLTQAQRLNNAATPERTTASSKDNKEGSLTPGMETKVTSSRMTRGHERARSEFTPGSPQEDVFGPTSPPQPGTPSRQRMPSFAASPHVKAAYGLKDSKLPPQARTSPQPANNENHDHWSQPSAAEEVKPVSASSQSSDAEVLGVLGINGQTQDKSSAAVRPSLRTFGRTPSNNASISPAKIRGPVMSAGVRKTSNSGTTTSRTLLGTSIPSARGVRGTTVQAKSRSTSSSSQSSSSGGSSKEGATTTTTTTATTRSRTESTGQRTLGLSRGLAERPTTRTTSRTPAPGAAPLRKTSRSGTTPISNSANAAMLAARANLKRARPSPDVGQTEFSSAATKDGGRDGAAAAGKDAESGPTTTSSRPPVSAYAASSRFGRNVRRRRSSLGAADIGMA